MSCFCCCTRSRQQQRRASEYSEAVEPTVVAINTLDRDGVQEQGTGIIICDHLVLTSHMGLPTRESARDGHIALESVGPSITSPNMWPSSSTILTRKLLPQRLFVTNPGLGLTIVACEPVNSSLSPGNYEVPKASEDGLKLGCSVYVLGQVQHDDREGLLMFGEGLVSKEDQQVIEFYSLDGYVWAPGSAGFDAKGTFAFVVGDRRPPPKVSCPLRRRWLYALSKGPGSTQPGILIHAVRDWTKDRWSGDFSTLQLCSSGPISVDTTSALQQKADEAKVIDRQKAPSKRIDQVDNTVRDDKEATTRPIRSSLQTYRATDSNSTVTSPKIKDIPVQGCFLPIPVRVACTHLDRNITVKPQSLPKLGGIAALAAEDLERYDDKSEPFAHRDAAGNETANRPVHDYADGSVDMAFHNEQEVICDGTPTCGSSQDELRSPRSCWLSSWWSNFRPKSPRRQRGQSVHAAAADSAAANECANSDAGKSEEVMTDCLEPNSPPRRFLVRGAYTATPRREFSSPQTSSHIPNPGATRPTSPQHSFSPLYNMIKPSSPLRTLRPCESTLQEFSRPLSPEIPYLQIHRSSTSGCPRQSDNPWKPPGEPDSRRTLPPEPPQLLTGVARTRTCPRDYCHPRSEEDEQKRLDEVAGRKVSAGTGTCMKVVELPVRSNATGSQDHLIQSPIAVQTSPRELCGENGTLESGSSSFLQSTRDHEVYEVNRVILPKSIRQTSTSRMTSRKTPQRVIKCTCFQRWQKFVTRKKNVAFESMRSLFSPRTLSVSTTSSRSISPYPALGSPPETTCTSYKLADSEHLSNDGASATGAVEWFLGSPSSIHNGSGCPEGQTVITSTTQQQSKEQVLINTPNDQSYHAKMPNWAMQPPKIQDDLLRPKQVLAYGEREGKTTVEAAAEVKIWNGSNIATPSRQDENGAKDQSLSTTSRSEVASRNRPQIEMCMMTDSKKERCDLRKETSNQRPRWSIARIDKGPLNTGFVFNPPDDRTKSKLRMRKQPLMNNTGPASAILSHEEGFVPKKNSGVKALANQHEVSTVRKAEHEGKTRASSPSTKPAPNSNCKVNVSSENSAVEHSMSPSKPVRCSSKRLLAIPIVRKGSSVSSSSSDREGRPRWRCP